MNPFDALLADFAQKTGLEFGGPGTDREADGVPVSAQYRAERDDCVIFSLPLEDTEPDESMLRRALELAANGGGTDGHFLGLKEGMFMLAAVLPLRGLSAEEFGRRLIALGEASKKVAEALSRASAEDGGGAGGGARPDPGGHDFMRV